MGVSSQWQAFLLWRNSSGVTFGVTDPLFGRDPAFYVFSLPWLEFLQGWLFSSAVGVTFSPDRAPSSGAASARRRARGGSGWPRRTRAHLSVLLGLIMFVKAWGYYLGRFDLLLSQRGSCRAPRTRRERAAPGARS